MNIRAFLMLAGFVALSLGAGAIGSLVTMDQIPTWYAALQKPVGTPPNWVFGPVWTTLYVLMGVAVFLVAHSRRRAGKTMVVWLFVAHLVVNVLWSVAFFGLKELELAIVVALMLVGSVGLLAFLYARFSRVASVLMLPYLAWVTYATYLTVGVFVLNGSQ